MRKPVQCLWGTHQSVFSVQLVLGDCGVVAPGVRFVEFITIQPGGSASTAADLGAILCTE